MMLIYVNSFIYDALMEWLKQFSSQKDLCACGEDQLILQLSQSLVKIPLVLV